MMKAELPPALAAVVDHWKRMGVTKPPMRPKMFTLPDSRERTLVGNTCVGVEGSVDSVRGGCGGGEVWGCKTCE